MSHVFLGSLVSKDPLSASVTAGEPVVRQASEARILTPRSGLVSKASGGELLGPSLSPCHHLFKFYMSVCLLVYLRQLTLEGMQIRFLKTEPENQNHEKEKEINMLARKVPKREQ